MQVCVNEHVTDRVCVGGAAQGRTPSVRLHRLPAQQRAAGKEAADSHHIKISEFAS